MFSLSLYSISAFLMSHGMLGLLITMPPALLLALGLKKKGRWTLLFSGSLMLSAACAVAGISIEGFETGRGFALSKSTLLVERNDQPIFFWISTFAFLFGSLVIALFGIRLIWFGLRHLKSEKISE